MENDIRPPVLGYENSSDNALTKLDLGILAVRLFGLYLLVEALMYASYLPSVFWMPASGGARPLGWLIIYAGPFVVNAAAGMVLLTRTQWIVRRAFPEFTANAALSATGRDIQAVAFSIVGVWLVATTIPAAARLATAWGSASPSRSSMYSRDVMPEAVRLAIQLVAGVLLFFRAQGLSALWHRLRYAGISYPPDDLRHDEPAGR
jgi:hypothetical protein